MNFAIIGASGNVGRKTIEILEKSKLAIDNLFLVASSKSAGKKIKFKNKEIEIEDLDKEADQIDQAVQSVLDDGLRTKDIMSKNMKEVSTTDMGDAIIAKLK